MPTAHYYRTPVGDGSYEPPTCLHAYVSVQLEFEPTPIIYWYRCLQISAGCETDTNA